MRFFLTYYTSEKLLAFVSAGKDW